jgi:predicted ferric reductase
VLVGKATLVFLIIQAVLGIYWERLGLTFEKWRKSHCVLAPVILILGFIHSWYAGDDLEHVELQIYWVIILLIGVIPFVWHKFIKPRTLSEYTVTDVKQESHNVWTIKLKPPEGETIYDYLPGQFHFLIFKRDPSLPVEEHHWTISGSPENRDYLSSTIKESGDFTSTIGSTKPGDTALVDGAYGRFSYTLHDHEDERVFIAGGIGITPFMSMLRHMRDTRVQKRVILIYANRGQDDLVFRSQLDEIAQGQYPDLKIVYVLSEPDPDWQGETGYVTGDLIKRHCPDDLASKHFYICGPPVMSEMVVNALQGMGVSTDRIRTERFSL